MIRFSHVSDTCKSINVIGYDEISHCEIAVSETN